MNPVITNVELQNVQDIVSAGYRARIIAEQLRFDKDDQTRISTAVSEIARNALQYAGKGRSNFSSILVGNPVSLASLSGTTGRVSPGLKYPRVGLPRKPGWERVSSMPKD